MTLRNNTCDLCGEELPIEPFMTNDFAFCDDTCFETWSQKVLGYDPKNDPDIGDMA